MEFARASRKKNSVNLTPLIDIIFLLVIFFMLTSKFVTSAVVDMNVSTVKGSASVSSKNEPILIILTEGGKFLLDGDEYKLGELEAKLGKLIEKDKNKDIVLMNKKGVSVQDLVTAMDSIKSSGGYNISIAEGTS